MAEALRTITPLNCRLGTSPDMSVAATARPMSNFLGILAEEISVEVGQHCNWAEDNTVFLGLVEAHLLGVFRSPGTACRTILTNQDEVRRNRPAESGPAGSSAHCSAASIANADGVSAFRG
jgi:hypothetical protein